MSNTEAKKAAEIAEQIKNGTNNVRERLLPIGQQIGETAAKIDTSSLFGASAAAQVEAQGSNAHPVGNTGRFQQKAGNQNTNLQPRFNRRG